MVQVKEKQPVGLYWLFMTELWERFGFYTIQIIAALYLTKGLGFDDDRAFLIIGGLNAMIYMTPVMGGMLADKIIGYQRAIMFGGSLLAVGYLIMAMPSESVFFLGAAIVILANGYFKPNVSSIVGDLYRKQDPRREGGFTIFYMGINVGALLPSLFIGWVVTQYGWHAGFFVATMGMVISLVTFLIGRHYIQDCGKIPMGSILLNAPMRVWGIIVAVTAVAVLLVFLLFFSPLMMNLVIIAISVIYVIYVLWITIKLERSDQARMLACLILILISIVFWMLYNQTFSSLMLFADRNMVQSFMGIPLTAENTQFFNPFFIIVFSPLIARLWIKLDQRSLNPSIAYKFSYSIVLIALGYFVLWFGVKYFSTAGLTASGWLAGSYMVQTLGELLISPVGLAMITVLVPRKYIAMMMGMWFLSQTAANSLSGLLAGLTSVPNGTSIQVASDIYEQAFLYFALIALVCAVLSFMVAPMINRLVQRSAH